MDKQQTLTELAQMLRHIADELERYGAKTASIQKPAISAIPAPATVPAPEHAAQAEATDISVASQILARVEHRVTNGRVGYTVMIASSLDSRLRALFAANVGIKKGDWCETAIWRQLKLCESLRGKALSAAVQHLDSRDRVSKQYFVSVELDARLKPFLHRNNIKLKTIICSALQRELQECEQINGRPFST
jgi:hypothetical protein